MVQTCGEASRQPLQLYALSAHDTHLAELVHQPGIACNRCSRVHVRLGHLLWRGTAVDCRHTSWQDIAKDEQLERRVLMDIDGIAVNMRIDLTAARIAEEQAEKESRIKWRLRVNCGNRGLDY